VATTDAERPALCKKKRKGQATLGENKNQNQLDGLGSPTRRKTVKTGFISPLGRKRRIRGGQAKQILPPRHNFWKRGLLWREAYCGGRLNWS
jgi:hypothetical protein